MERTGRSLETSSFWDYGHLTIAANHRRGKGNRQCAQRNVKRVARNGCDRAASSTMELRQKVGPVEPVGAEAAMYSDEDKAFYVKRMWAEGLTPTAASRLWGAPSRRTLAAWEKEALSGGLAVEAPRVPGACKRVEDARSLPRGPRRRRVPEGKYYRNLESGVSATVKTTNFAIAH